MTPATINTVSIKPQRKRFSGRADADSAGAEEVDGASVVVDMRAPGCGGVIITRTVLAHQENIGSLSWQFRPDVGVRVSRRMGIRSGANRPALRAWFCRAERRSRPMAR